MQKSEELINRIFSTGKIEDASGNERILDSNIDMEEGNFLQKIITENSYKNSIEIGCAHGVSSLFICSALVSQNGFHSIIDPFQSTQWGNTGISQLQKAGFENFQLIEKGSEIALPGLLDEGASFDFAFIDGWHTFDHTLLDMFYINRLLKVGGTLVIDDASMQSVERAVNYFLNYPAYEFVGGVSVVNSAGRRGFDKFVINPLRFIGKMLPLKIRKEIFSGKIVNKTIDDYSMVALKKIKEDERPWNWFIPF